jgi:adenosine deaminase
MLVDSSGENKSRLWYGFHCRSHTTIAFEKHTFFSIFKHKIARKLLLALYVAHTYINISVIQQSTFIYISYWYLCRCRMQNTAAWKLQFSPKFVSLKRNKCYCFTQTVKCFYSNLKFEIEMLFVSKSWGWNKKKLDVNKIDGYASYTLFPFFKEGK